MRSVMLLAVAVVFYLMSRSYMHLFDPGASGQPLCAPGRLNDADQAVTDSAVGVFLAVLVSPVCEEFLFRRWLFQRLRRWFDVGGQVLLSSLCFAAAHTQYWWSSVHLPELVQKVASGILFGQGYAIRFALVDSVLLHAATNALILAPKQAVSDLCVATPWPLHVAAIAVGAGLIVLLFRCLRAQCHRA